MAKPTWENNEEFYYYLSKVIENSIEGDWTGINHEKWLKELREFIDKQKKQLLKAGADTLAIQDKLMKLRRQERVKIADENYKAGQMALKKDLISKIKGMKIEIKKDEEGFERSTREDLSLSSAIGYNKALADIINLLKEEIT